MSTVHKVVTTLSTVSVTRIDDAEFVLTGGLDGQVYIGTFVDERLAEGFVHAAQEYPDATIRGTRMYP